MTFFEQFIFIYFISITALAGFAVLWRNWLEDHRNWENFLHKNLGSIAKALTCGSCFTFWVTLIFIIIANPLGMLFRMVPLFSNFPVLCLYVIQWMSFGFGVVFFRFLYVTLQETVNILVHRFGNRDHQ